MGNAEGKEYLRDEDREFFARELESFIPDRIFDAHCHLSLRDDLIAKKGLMIPEQLLARDLGYDEYRRSIDYIHPGRRTSSLFIPGPVTREHMAESNEWVAREAARDPSCRALFFAAPQDDPEWVRERVLELGLCGLKVYHLLSSVVPSWEADIPSYLPENLVKVADEEGWVITLHMVKHRAVADPDNIRWIRHYCEKYPNMKLILAHSARGFQPAHNLEGLHQLTGFENLYFDSSANCEPVAHQAIIRIHGHLRLMYGTDFFVSHLRGRSVAAADSFLWLYENSPVWGEKHTHIKPVLVGLEHLRALKWACWSERLSDSQIEDIFWNNAAGLFGVK